MTFYFVSDCGLLCPDTIINSVCYNCGLTSLLHKTGENDGNKQNTVHNWDVFCHHVSITPFTCDNCIKFGSMFMKFLNANTDKAFSQVSCDKMLFECW